VDSLIVLIVLAVVGYRVYEALSRRIGTSRSSPVRRRRPRRTRAPEVQKPDRRTGRITIDPVQRLRDDTDEGVSLEHPYHDLHMKAYEDSDREHRLDYATRHRVRTWNLRLNENTLLSGVVMSEILGPPKARENMARQRRLLQQALASRQPQQP